MRVSNSIYRKAGNFRGGGGANFVVDLAVTKFSCPRKLKPTVMWRVHDDEYSQRYENWRLK